MTAFVDEVREELGVEPVYEVLQFAPSRHYAAKARGDRPSQRELRNEELKTEMQRVYDDNRQVCGARKVWRQLQREGIEVARCTIERLMRVLGLAGAVRGRTVRTFKTESIKPGRPWRTRDDVEIAMLTWVDWCNRQRLHSSIGNLPPIEYEAMYYRSHQATQST